MYGLFLDGGDVTGELQFYTIVPYYRFHRIKVKTNVRGFLKSSQMKNLSEKLDEISVALGEVPLLTPKEFRRSYKKIFEEKEVELFQNLEDHYSEEMFDEVGRE